MQRVAFVGEAQHKTNMCQSRPALSTKSHPTTSAFAAQHTYTCALCALCARPLGGKHILPPRGSFPTRAQERPQEGGMMLNAGAFSRPVWSHPPHAMSVRGRCDTLPCCRQRLRA